MTKRLALMVLASVVTVLEAGAYDLHTRELMPVVEKPRPAGNPMAFVRDGQVDFTIVTDRPSKAADMLAEAFEKTTGSRPEIVRDTETKRIAAHRYVLAVGDSKIVRDEAKVDWRELPVQGFSIKSFPRGLAVVGFDSERIPGWKGRPFDRRGASTGTWYAAVDFAERFLGCRFFFPGEYGTLWPACRDLAIAPVHYEDAPRFSLRVCPYWLWYTVRNEALVKKWSGYMGRGIRKGDMSFLDFWRKSDIEPLSAQHCPFPQQYAKVHPDRVKDIFFTSPSGKFWYNPGGHSGNYFDVTNLRFADLLVEDYKAMFASEGRDDRGGLGKNACSAWASFGVCDTSMPLTDMATHPTVVREGLIGEREMKGPERQAFRNVYGRFNHYLATEFAKACPGKKLWFLAYYEAQYAPTDPKWFLPDNAEVMLCLGDMPGKIPDPERSAKARRCAEEWYRALGNRPVQELMLYSSHLNPFKKAIIPEYVTGLSKVFGKTVGGKNLFIHYDDENLWHYYWAPYVFERAQWNPDFDADAAIDAHWAPFYGAEAGAHLKEFHRVLKDSYVRYCVPTSESMPVYPAPVLNALERELAAAGACLRKGTPEWHRWRLVSDYWKEPIRVQRTQSAYTTPVYSVTRFRPGMDWTKVPEMGLQDIFGADPAKHPICIKMAWDEKGLRGRVSSAMKPSADAKRDEFHNDSFELFLSPGTKRESYSQFVWDFVGHKMSLRQQLLPIIMPHDMGWKAPGSTFKGAASANGVTGEFFVPYADLGVPMPRFGEHWYANAVFANRFDQEKWVMRGSAMTMGDNANVTMFGVLRFAGDSVEPTIAEKDFKTGNDKTNYHFTFYREQPDKTGRRKLVMRSRSGVNAGFVSGCLGLEVDGVSHRDAEMRDDGPNAVRLGFGDEELKLRAYMKDGSELLWFDLTGAGRAKTVRLTISSLPSHFRKRADGSYDFSGYHRRVVRPKEGTYVFLDDEFDGSAEGKGVGPSMAVVDLSKVVSRKERADSAWMAEETFELKPQFGTLTFGLYESNFKRRSNKDFLAAVPR